MLRNYFLNSNNFTIKKKMGSEKSRFVDKSGYIVHSGSFKKLIEKCASYRDFLNHTFITYIIRIPTTQTDSLIEFFLKRLCYFLKISIYCTKYFNVTPLAVKELFIFYINNITWKIFKGASFEKEKSLTVYSII